MALAVAPNRSQGGQSFPEGETEDVTCHLYCPPSLCFIPVSVDRNGQTDSSVSEGLLSSLPPYSL